MAVIETNYTSDVEITTRQRWSHYFSVGLGVLAVVLLFNLRVSTLNATTLYQNTQEGITAAYPTGWLIDEDGDTDYIFRVRNMQEIGFKTTFRISVQAVGANTTTRTLFDALTMQRAQSLTAYRNLAVEPYFGLEDREASLANYQYVATDPNPYEESVPIVVRGVDILTVNRDQAIIITMLSDADHFDQNFALFEQFISRLEF